MTKRLGIKRRLSCALLMVAMSGTVQAHELFLQPQTYQLAVGDPLVAEVKVGENFDGSRSIYNPDKFRRFDLAFGETVVPVPGRLGDLPSVNLEVEEDGLHILIHVSTDQKLRYTDFAKLRKFANHKDLREAIQAHDDRGLPKDSFTEAYSRYAKSLIAVGDGVGQDRAFGLETEIVALDNPYTDDLWGEIAVQVFYQEQPRANAQVEMFERIGRDVTVTWHRTDEEGRAFLPVQPGGEYMVDAVLIREPDAALSADLDAVWETLWANLTFAVPE